MIPYVTLPNASLQPLPIAGAQRRLSAVGCKALFGLAWDKGTGLLLLTLPQKPLGRKRQTLCVLVDSVDDLLDRLDCCLFEIRFTALGAHPSWDRIED